MGVGRSVKFINHYITQGIVDCDLQELSHEFDFT